MICMNEYSMRKMVGVCLTVALAGGWTYLPPTDADPSVAILDNPIPRRWSGQKAALAFARLGDPMW